MTPYSYKDTGFALKTVFDMMFFIFVNFISLNIIFGIIIDSFASLRDEQGRRTNENENVCFVCGRTRMQFEQIGSDFGMHTKQEHYPWAYANYIFYIF
jgi:hypothetical protein